MVMPNALLDEASSAKPPRSRLNLACSPPRRLAWRCASPTRRTIIAGYWASGTGSVKEHNEIDLDQANMQTALNESASPPLTLLPP